MTSAPLRLFVLSAALLTAATALPVAARPVDCDGTGVAKCVISSDRSTERTTERTTGRIQSSRQGFSSGTHTPKLSAQGAPSAQTQLTGWASSAAPRPPESLADEGAASLTWDAAPGGDRPYLALLLATVGIVAFMAHRRSGS